MTNPTNKDFLAFRERVEERLKNDGWTREQLTSMLFQRGLYLAYQDRTQERESELDRAMKIREIAMEEGALHYREKLIAAVREFLPNILHEFYREMSAASVVGKSLAGPLERRAMKNKYTENLLAALLRKDNPTSRTQEREELIAAVEFEKEFPTIMARHKVGNFPSGAFYELKSFIAKVEATAYDRGYKQAGLDCKLDHDNARADERRKVYAKMSLEMQSLAAVLARRDSKMHVYWKSVIEDGFDGGYPDNFDDELREYVEAQKEKARLELGTKLSAIALEEMEAERQRHKKELTEQLQEERQFILNVLDGIDKAEKFAMSVNGGTKAIRFALANRLIS